MSSASCERCGSPAPEALLRSVSLNVDGSEVDSQTICPDCFSDWIAHYQEEMAGDMPGADAARNASGGDALSETVRAASERADAAEGTSDQRLQDAVENGATTATPPGQQREPVDDAGASGGNEIREVGGAGGANDAGDDVAVDLGGNDGVDVNLDESVEDDDEDDDGGLLLG